MRTGCAARIACLADHIACFDDIARFDIHLAQMHEDRDESLSMIEEDRAAFIIKIGIAKDDDAVSRGQQRRADRGCNVISTMHGNAVAWLARDGRHADIFARRAEWRRHHTFGRTDCALGKTCAFIEALESRDLLHPGATGMVFLFLCAGIDLVTIQTGDFAIIILAGRDLDGFGDALSVRIFKRNGNAGRRIALKPDSSLTGRVQFGDRLAIHLHDGAGNACAIEKPALLARTGITARRSAFSQRGAAKGQDRCRKRRDCEVKQARLTFPHKEAPSAQRRLSHRYRLPAFQCSNR